MIKFVTGPVCAGKSEDAQIVYMMNPYKSIVLKPWTADRDGPFLKSRASSRKIAARMVDPALFAESILLASEKGYDHIIVDEGQDFAPPTPWHIMSLIGIDVTVYSLNVWADGTETWCREAVKGYAHHIALFATCALCGNKSARYTMHISGTNRITAKYEPVCLDCFKANQANPNRAIIQFKPKGTNNAPNTRGDSQM